MNVLSKLQCLITINWKGLPGIEPICKLQRKLSVVNMAPGAVFTTLHYFHNLRMGPMSKVCYISLTWKVLLAMDKHSSLLGQFISCTSCKKMKYCEYGSHQFICSSRMGPINQSVTIHLLEIIVRNKHSSLLGPFTSWKEKETLSVILEGFLISKGKVAFEITLFYSMCPYLKNNLKVTIRSFVKTGLEPVSLNFLLA